MSFVSNHEFTRIFTQPNWTVLLQSTGFCRFVRGLQTPPQRKVAPEEA